MKLSEYAKRVGVTYKTAWQWWNAGQLDAYQLPTGTIIVREPQSAASGVALYARVSSADQKEDVARQMQRLREYAAARGYQVVAEVTEIASGLNDERPKLKKALTDPRVGVLVVEHKDRLTRFGYGYIAMLLEQQGRRVEAIYPSDTGDGLVDDFVAVITSMAARIYGRSHLWPLASMAVAIANVVRSAFGPVWNTPCKAKPTNERDPRLQDRA